MIGSVFVGTGVDGFIARPNSAFGTSLHSNPSGLVKTQYEVVV
jgi:hypothetical protein